MIDDEWYYFDTETLTAVSTYNNGKVTFEFKENGKLLSAVCAAPTVYGQLGILKDHKATCYPGQEVNLNCAEYLTEPVVIDGQFTTSRGMGTCIEFAGAIITRLKDKETADDVKAKIIYNM